MQHISPNTATNLEPAVFKDAFEYLSNVEKNNANVDWELLSNDPKVYTDVMLLRIMHLAARDKKRAPKSPKGD